MLGLRFCARAFSSCGERGPLFIAVRRPLTTAASLVAEHRLQTRRLSSCGSRAQLLRGMWDLPKPGLEPVSPNWQADSQPLHHQGSPRSFISYCLYLFILLLLIVLQPVNHSNKYLLITLYASHEVTEKKEHKRWFSVFKIIVL